MQQAWHGEEDVHYYLYLIRITYKYLIIQLLHQSKCASNGVIIIHYTIPIFYEGGCNFSLTSIRISPAYYALYINIANTTYTIQLNIKNQLPDVSRWKHYLYARGIQLLIIESVQ